MNAHLDDHALQRLAAQLEAAPPRPHHSGLLQMAGRALPGQPFRFALTYDGWPVERILAPYILTKDQRREIPVIGDPDEQTLSRVKAFYNGIAALIEKECGLMAVPMMNITHEGFGRALITVGKLVVMDRTVRDVHRYGYDSLSKMKDEADKLLSVALKIIGTHREVAEL